MAYVQPCNKRQKTVREPTRNIEVTEYLPGINKIEFKGDTAPYDETMCYRYYNANERIHGRTMEDWIRPAVSLTAFKYSGTDSFGKPTFQRTWDDHSQSLENYKRHLKAGFEFCTKLGIKHWTAYDRDLIPEMDTFEENVISTDEMTEFIQEMQQRTGIKPLWIAPDLHTSPKYASGAASSYDSNIMMQAAQQVKRCLETSHKLNSECFLIWGGREGYHSILNTDVHREIKHFARLLKMTSDFKERLGYRGQLLLQPWRRTECDRTCDYNISETAGKLNEFYSANDNRVFHHYNWDVTSGLCFLKQYNLDRHYKICVRPGYQFYLSSAYNCTGSLEITREDSLDVKNATLMMKNIIEQGGIQPGGINIRVILNRDSVEMKDLFVSYISCIDTLARGLRISTKMLTDQTFTKNLQQRYISYYNGFGSRLSNGEASLEECEEQVRKLQNQCPDIVTSSRHEHWEVSFKNFINKNI